MADDEKAPVSAPAPSDFKAPRNAADLEANIPKGSVRVTSNVRGLGIRAGDVVKVSDLKKAEHPDLYARLVKAGRIEDAESGKKEQPALSSMNKKQLLAAAKKEGVDVAENDTVDDIKAAIQAKRDQ